MDWIKLLQEIFTICIIPLLGILTKYFISFSFCLICSEERYNLAVSKDLSLPGERIGALIMNPEIQLCERNIHALSIANEFLAIYPPNRLHMRALPKLLKHTSNLECYTECQEIAEETLKKLNI